MLHTVHRPEHVQIGRFAPRRPAYVRTTDTTNLVLEPSPFPWHQRLIGQLMEMLRAAFGRF